MRKLFVLLFVLTGSMLYANGVATRPPASNDVQQGGFSFGIEFGPRYSYCRGPYYRSGYYYGRYGRYAYYDCPGYYYDGRRTYFYYDSPGYYDRRGYYHHKGYYGKKHRKH